jgi:branched-chain amino acid transport system ATP-binding protein
MADSPPSVRAEPAILTVSGLGKRFGGFVALDNINLAVAPGERLGLIGPNGSGKSTLVNCLCGTLQNETGSVVFDGRPLDGLIAHQRTRLGLARSFQLPKPFHTLDLVDNLRVPLIYTVNARHGARHGRERHHLSARQVEESCHELLRQVGLGDKMRRLPRDLTQVEMRKLELARAVATEPRLLFADEAMAGLSHAEIEDILAVLFRLNEQGITIVLIEHIMSAVMSFSTRLVVLVAGQKIADGPPQEVVRNPEVERAYLGE